VLLLAGCGGSGGDDSGSTAPCDDAAFRAQDEELYVTHATVSNAIGGGDPATLLLDLRRARTALAGYLDAHPPCDRVLVRIATTEREAITDLDDAIAELDRGAAAGVPLARALEALESARSRLDSSL
jgi:hypothetical protein